MESPEYISSLVLARAKETAERYLKAHPEDAVSMTDMANDDGGNRKNKRSAAAPVSVALWARAAWPAP